MKQIVLVDIFKSLVEKVSAAQLGSLQSFEPTITGVYFMHGHPLDIRKRLLEKNATNEERAKKYPLIALFQDFVEKNDVTGITTVNLQLIMGYYSEKDYFIEDRYNKIIKPILYPIYDEFLTQIANNVLFTVSQPHQIAHKKIDRPHWGNAGTYGTDSYIFGDVLDALEIRDLELKYEKGYCKK